MGPQSRVPVDFEIYVEQPYLQQKEVFAMPEESSEEEVLKEVVYVKKKAAVVC